MISFTFVTLHPILVTYGNDTMEGIDLVFYASQCVYERSNSINTGKLETEITYASAPKDEKQTVEAIKALEEYYKWSCGDDLKLFQEKTKNLNETLKRQTNFYVDEKKTQVTFWFSGNFYANYMRKFEALDLPYREGANRRLGLFYRSPQNEFTTLNFDPSMEAAVVNHSFSVSENLMQLGQIQGDIANIILSALQKSSIGVAKAITQSNIAEFKKFFSQDSLKENMPLFQIVGGVEYEPGCFAKIVESKVNDKIILRYWIDASKGFVCPLTQQFDPNNGELAKEYRSSAYFLHEQTGLWFPSLYTETVKDASNGKLIDKKHVVINRSSLALNTPLSKNDFAIDIPSGLKVIDARPLPTITYTADTSGVLSLTPGGLDLQKMSWLRKVGDLPKIQTQNRYTFLQYLFMGIGAGLVILAIIKRIKKNKNKLGLILLPLLLSSVMGCSTTTNETTGDDEKIVVNPSTLDFGYARPTDSPVVLHFDIINKSSENLVISDIVSGCSCTVVEIPQEPIIPGKTASASVKVNLLGRMGDFTNSVVIKTQNHGMVSLDIRGTIETDIWYNGQAIRCTAVKDQRVVPTTLALYTLKYPDIEFDWSKLYDDVGAKIVSRERRESGETMIQLAIDVDIGDNEMMSSSLNLVPADKNIAPLMIPVYCSRDEEPQSVPQLLTSQISLGSLENNQSREFSVFGDPDILQVVRSVELRNVPASFSIHLLAAGENSKNNELKIKLEVQGASAGFIEGILVLKTVGSREYTIPFLCEIRQ